MTDQHATARLNELMLKKGLTPKYELVESATGTHINRFVMRVECSITRDGPICSADGFGLSKKEAKREAALAFMQKYNLGDQNNNPAVIFKTASNAPQCVINIQKNNRNTVLQALCMKYNLERPEYEEVRETGPPHLKRFTIRCRVSDLSTEGVGTTKSEAKLDATTNMMRVLMQEAEVYEIFESPKSIVTLTNSNGIICLSDNVQVGQPPGPVSIFGRRRSSSSSSEMFTGRNISNICLAAGRKSRDKECVALTLLHNCKNVGNAAENSDDSVSNGSLIDLEDEDCQQSKAVSYKGKSKSLNNLSESGKNSNRSKALDKISAKLESIEEELCNEVLDTLKNRDTPDVRTVTILSHEFVIFINNNTRPKIFEGDEECTDSSIRIAALAKILMDIKDRAKDKCGKSDKE